MSLLIGDVTVGDARGRAVHVLDGLPDPPATFASLDVFDALAAARRAGVDGAAAADVGAVLDALLAHELVASVRGRRYAVVPDARPF